MHGMYIDDSQVLEPADLDQSKMFRHCGIKWVSEYWVRGPRETLDWTHNILYEVFDRVEDSELALLGSYSVGLPPTIFGTITRLHTTTWNHNYYFFRIFYYFALIRVHVRRFGKWLTRYSNWIGFFIPLLVVNVSKTVKQVNFWMNESQALDTKSKHELNSSCENFIFRDDHASHTCLRISFARCHKDNAKERKKTFFTRKS